MHSNEAACFPEFIVFSEALTDMICLAPNTWRSKNGGAGWNIACVMAKLGIRSAFAGAISQDNFGDALWRASKEAHLDMRFIQRYAKNPLLAIVYALAPVRYYFIGEASADLFFDPALLPAAWEKHVKTAYFGSISLSREPLASCLIALAERLKRQGVRIVYDPNFRVTMTASYDATLARMVALADIVKISDEDLQGLFRTDNQQTAFAQLRAFNPTAVYLYTRGAQGASLHVGDKAWQAVPPPLTVVDTVGAGDASFGGLIAQLCQQPDTDWPNMLRAAVATGSAACLVEGAGLPSVDIIANIREHIKVNVISNTHVTP